MGAKRATNIVRPICLVSGEPRSGDIYIAWGVSPRFRSKKKRQAAKRRQTIGGERLQLTLQPKSAAPPGLILREYLVPWG